MTNLSLGNLLRSLIGDHPKEWEGIQPIAEFAFNRICLRIRIRICFYFPLFLSHLYYNQDLIFPSITPIWIRIRICFFYFPIISFPPLLGLGIDFPINYSYQDQNQDLFFISPYFFLTSIRNQDLIFPSITPTRIRIRICFLFSLYFFPTSIRIRI